jgi:acetyl esterase/lipase
MTLRLHGLNLYLRLVEKPWLARVRDPAELRRRFEQSARRWFAEPEGARYLDLSLAGLRCLEASAGPVAQRRLLLWFHGGAFVQGSPATHRHLAAAISARSGARVILPDYRLAPENPFPAAIEDARAVWRALREAGYGPAEIALGGDSAGGGIAFALLHLIAAAGPERPACILAFSPWVDLTLTAASLTRNARADPLLPVSRMEEVRTLWLAGADPRDPRASPLFGRFPDPPPALIQASRIEILEDDATAMAARLRDAGGAVRLEFWKETPHVWQIFQGRLAEADAALDSAGGFLRRHLGERRAEAEPAWA